MIQYNRESFGGNELSRETIYVKNHYRYDAIFIFSILAMSIGLLFDSPKEIFDG